MASTPEERFAVSHLGDGEAVEHRWVHRDVLPEPLHPPTKATLAMFEQYEATGGTFQAG